MTQSLADELLGPVITTEAEAMTVAHRALWETVYPTKLRFVSGPIRFVILGEPVSKANSRRLVAVGKKDQPKRTLFIKSAKGRTYERDAGIQIPAQWPLITGPVAVTLRLWYASERPDLDESIVLDVMQGRIYVNDRQVREKHVFHGIDRANPRAEVEVRVLSPQQIAFDVAQPL